MAQVLDLAKRQFKGKARMPWVKIQNAQKCMYKSIKQLQMYNVTMYAHGRQKQTHIF